MKKNKHLEMIQAELQSKTQLSEKTKKSLQMCFNSKKMTKENIGLVNEEQKLSVYDTKKGSISTLFLHQLTASN